MEDSRTKDIIHLLIGLLIFLIVPLIQPSLNLSGITLIPLILQQLGISHQQETLANITYLEITSISNGIIASNFAYDFLHLYHLTEFVIMVLIYMYILGQYIVKYIILRKHDNIKYKS
jgi:hypothetical protein